MELEELEPTRVYIAPLDPTEKNRMGCAWCSDEGISRLADVLLIEEYDDARFPGLEGRHGLCAHHAECYELEQ